MPDDLQVSPKVSPATPSQERKSIDPKERMNQFARSEVKRAGGTVEKVDKGGKADAGAAPGPKDQTTSLPEKPEVKPEKKPDEPPKQEGKPAEAPKPVNVNWEEESKKFQSRADQAEAKIKEGEKILSEARTLKEEHAKYKEWVEGFQKDPTGFLARYTPDLAKRMQLAGDPVALIEHEVTEYQSKLDEQFKKSFGEDWQYNELEALKPGTPSFRYRLAVEDRIQEVRSRHRDYVESQRRGIEQAEVRKREDVERLKKDYNFTDDDIKRAQESLNKLEANYYNFLKLALMDDIMDRKVKALVPAPPPPNDISNAPKGGDEAADERPKVSAEGRRMLSRVGAGLLR